MFRIRSNHPYVCSTISVREFHINFPRPMNSWNTRRRNIPLHPRAQISMSSTLTSPTTPTPQHPAGLPFRAKSETPHGDADDTAASPAPELFPEGEWASSFAQLAPETTLAYWQITTYVCLANAPCCQELTADSGRLPWSPLFEATFLSPSAG